MPMMKMGSHRLPELMVIGPMLDALAISTIESEIASRIDRKGPEHVEEAREHRIDDAAEEAGDEPDQRAEDQADDVAAPAISSELRPP